MTLLGKWPGFLRSKTWQKKWISLKIFSHFLVLFPKKNSTPSKITSFYLGKGRFYRFTYKKSKQFASWNPFLGDCCCWQVFWEKFKEKTKQVSLFVLLFFFSIWQELTFLPCWCKEVFSFQPRQSLPKQICWTKIKA